MDHFLQADVPRGAQEFAGGPDIEQREIARLARERNAFFNQFIEPVFQPQRAQLDGVRAKRVGDGNVRPGGAVVLTLDRVLARDFPR